MHIPMLGINNAERTKRECSRCSLAFSFEALFKILTTAALLFLYAFFGFKISVCKQNNENYTVKPESNWTKKCVFPSFFSLCQKIFFRPCDQFWNNHSCVGWFRGEFVDAKMCYKSLHQPRDCSFLLLSLPKHDFGFKLSFKEIYNTREILLHCSPLGCGLRDIEPDSHLNIANVLFLYFNSDGSVNHTSIKNSKTALRYTISLSDFKMIKDLILSCYWPPVLPIMPSKRPALLN